MTLERLGAHEDELGSDRRPRASREPAVAVPAPGERWDAGALLRLSGAAGNQAVVRSLLAARGIQRTLNKGDLSSKVAANPALEPAEGAAEVLQAGPTFAINATFGDPTRQWIQKFCRANGNVNRFSETFGVTFAKGDVKVKKDMRPKAEGAATLAIEVDMRGAAHGSVATPHFKIWSKYGDDRSLMRPWPEKVFPLSDGQIRTILTANTLDSLTGAWTTHIQKYYTFKNFGESYVP